MQLNLTTPLVFFDLETTGTNISSDRIIEGAFVKMSPDGSQEEMHILVNPGVPIPEESSMIHGIRDADVKDQPLFKEVAAELSAFLEGCDLSGFNILRFDVPMLVEEFLRAEVDFHINNRRMVDSQKIFHLMEKRTLGAALKFYCGEELTDAHSAMADTRASLKVLQAQVERYENEVAKDLQGNPVGTIVNDMEALHNLTSAKMVDLAGRMVLNENNEAVFNFGKHKGRRVADIFDVEPSYYDWMMRGDFPMDTKRHLTQIRLQKFGRSNVR